MNVSALEEYGLRCAARLAQLKDGETLSASEIAESEGLSVEYVSKFMLHLKRAGLVKTLRGIHGGFSLAKPPSEISIKAVLDGLKGPRESASFCDGFSGRQSVCARRPGCSIRPFWGVLEKMFDGFTSRLSLEDLISSESETYLRAQQVAHELCLEAQAEVEFKT